MLTVAFILLILGIVLVILGYTAAPQTRMPGWACLIAALVLILIAYLIPATYIR